MTIAVPPSRFWSRVVRTEGCWLWTGHSLPAGYGHTKIEGKMTLAHRHSWGMVHGPIPDGLMVLHQCDNPSCVRPDHLYLGTAKDNARDCLARKRHVCPRGEQRPNAKLDSVKVLAIRKRHAAGERLTDLAREHSTTTQNVFRIVTRRSWRHLTEEC